jgi:hypothetical protein
MNCYLVFRETNSSQEPRQLIGRKINKAFKSLEEIHITSEWSLEWAGFHG